MGEFDDFVNNKTSSKPGSFDDFATSQKQGGEFDAFVQASKIPNNPRAEALIRGAKALGVDPVDYATAISYETGGTFNPWQRGPVTKWGQHRGTIQYGEPQAKQYGVHKDQSFEDQVTNSNVRYLRDRGVKPGATFDQIYAAINGGKVDADLNTQDWNTGRTIADNIRNAQRDHRQKAIQFLGGNYGSYNVTPQSFVAPNNAPRIDVNVGDIIDTQPLGPQAPITENWNPFEVANDIPAQHFNIEPDDLSITPFSQPAATNDLSSQYADFLKYSGLQDSPEAQKSFNEQMMLAENNAKRQQEEANQAAQQQAQQNQVVQPPNEAKTGNNRPTVLGTDPSKQIEGRAANKVRYYSTKPTAEQVVQESALELYGKEIVPVQEIYREATGKPLLQPSPALQQDIDQYWNPKTGEYADQGDAKYTDVESLVNAYKEGGTEGLKAKIERTKPAEVEQPTTESEDARKLKELVDAVNLTDDQLRTKIREDLESRPGYLQQLAETFGVGGAARKVLGKNPVTDEEIEAEFQRIRANQLSPEDIAGAKRVAEQSSPVAGGVFGGAGRAFTAAAGVVRPLSGLGVNAPYEFLSNVGKKLQTTQSLTNDGSLTSELANMAGGLPFDLGRLALLSKLPGGSVVGFAADSGLQSAGSGGTLSEVKSATEKGAAMGALFPLAGKVGQAASRLSPYLEPIARIGTVGVGTTGIELATGSSLKDSVKSGILNAVFEGVQTYGAQMLGKIGRIWSKGKPVDVHVDETGNVSLVKFKSNENPNRVDFEMVLDPTDGVYKTKFEGKEKVEDFDAMQEGNIPNNKVDVVNPEPAGYLGAKEPQRLTEKNPIRIENPRTEAVNKVKSDQRAQKILQTLESGDALSLEQLQKSTKYSFENTRQAVDDLYAARAIEILPDNTVRLIKSEHVQPKVNNLYEEYSSVKEPIQLGESPEAENIRKAEVQEYRKAQEAKNSKEIATVNFDEPLQGKPQMVRTERGTKTKVYPRVIEASELITSLDPNYPMEFQPRDRSRVASKAQISEIANTLEPAFLDDSPKASDGRPLVVPVQVNGQTKYAVISGNGRTEAIREAYNIGKEPSAEYKKFTVEKGANPNLSQPIYVGVLDPNEVKDLSEFAREANEQATAQMSATETAKADAERMTPEVLNAFIPSEDGSIHPTANKDFIQSFMDKVPKTERGALVLPNGQLSQAGQTRIKNAILAKAYGNSERGNDLIRRITETDDSGAKRITGALMQTAGKFAGLKQAISDGVRYENLDITDNLVKAAEKFVYLKGEKTPVSQYIQQQKMFGDDLSPFESYVLQTLDKHESSQKALAGIFNNYIIAANALGDPNQQGLFGANETPDAPTLFRAAIEEYEAGNYEVTQPNLEIQPAPSEVSQISDSQGTQKPETEKAQNGEKARQSGIEFIPSSLGKENVVGVTSKGDDWIVEFDTGQKMDVPIYLGNADKAIEYASDAQNRINNSEDLHNLSQNAEKLSKNVQELEKTQISPIQRAELRRSLSPSELKAQGIKPLGEKGQFGQTSYKIRQAMFVEDSPLLSDLAKVFDVRVKPTDDVQMASNAVLDAVAESVGKSRSSQMDSNDWHTVLEAEADKMSDDSVTAILDAITHQQNWNKQITNFTQDEELVKVIDSINDEINSGKMFRDLPFPARKEILRIGRKYEGISDTSIKESFNQTVSGIVQEKSRQSEIGTDEKTSGSESQIEKETSEPKSAQRYAERVSGQESGSEIESLKEKATLPDEHSSDRAVSRVSRQINKLADKDLSIDTLAKHTKIEQKDDIVYINPFGAELVRKVLARSRGEDESSFLGQYLTPRGVDRLLTQLQVERLNYSRDLVAKSKLFQIENILKHAVDKDYTDLIIVVGKGHPTTLQEERAHRADFRVRDFIGQNLGDFVNVPGYVKAFENVLDEYGEGFPPSIIHAEVIAKTFRDDGAKTLGISEDEIDAIQAKYYEVNVNSGKDFIDIEKAFTLVKSNKSERFLENVRNGFEGYNVTDGRKGADEILPVSQSQGEVRPRSNSSGSETSQGIAADRLGGIQFDEFFNGTGSEATALAKRADTFLTELEKSDKEIESLYSKAPAERKEETKSLFKKVVYDTRETSVPEVVVGLRRAGLLTGVKTHLRNLLGNTAFQISEEAHRPISMLIDAAVGLRTKQRTVEMLNPLAVAKSIAAVMRQDKTLQSLDMDSGIKKAWSIIRHGDTKENLEKQQLSEYKSGLKILDAYVNFVFRTLSAEDALFKTYSIRRSLEEQATTLAKSEAKSNPRVNWREKRKELLEKPTPQMQTEAILFGDYMTFQNDNVISGAITKAKTNLRESGTGGRLAVAGSEILMPFDKTPTNIVLRTLDYTPLGLARAGGSGVRMFRGQPKGMEDVEYFDQKVSRINQRRAEIRKNWQKNIERQVELKEVELKRLDNEIKSLEAQKELSPSLKRRLDALKAKANSVNSRINELNNRIKVQEAKSKLKDADLSDVNDAVRKTMETVLNRREQAQFATSIGRAGLGTAALVLGVLLASKGLLRGIWNPDDKDEQKEFFNGLNSDVLNGSLEIPKVGRFVITDSPMGKIMVAGATLYEQSQRPLKKGETKTGKGFDVATDVASNIALEQPLLGTINEYFGKNKTMEQRAGNLIGSFVPAILNSWAEIQDKEARDAKGLLQPAMKRIPYVRENLPVAKYPRSPFLRNTGGRILNQVDPTSYRPPKK